MIGGRTASIGKLLAKSLEFGYVSLKCLDFGDRSGVTTAGNCEVVETFSPSPSVTKDRPVGHLCQCALGFISLIANDRIKGGGEWRCPARDLKKTLQRFAYRA